jgi:hypothetical protein
MSEVRVMKRYLKETIGNKIASLVLLGLGYLTTFFGDLTAFAFIAMIAVPLFFERNNMVIEKGDEEQ